MSDDGPVPGWYDDPLHASQYRYWDGKQWSDHVAPKTVAPPPGPARPYHDSNAGWALGLSIFGILCCGPLSIVGFVMGMRELKAYREGLISPQDRGLALAAAIIGGIVMALLVLGIILFVLFALLAGDPESLP